MLQVAEAAKRKAEEELKLARAEASSAAELAAAQLAASRALAVTAESALAAKNAEVCARYTSIILTGWPASMSHLPSKVM